MIVIVDSVEMPQGFDWRSIQPEKIYSTAIESKTVRDENGKIKIPGKIVITTKDFAAKHKLPDLMPLFVVDGKDLSRDAYDSMHLPQDQILHTSFRKDSSTLQTFGSRARNGVLFIETKKAPHPDTTRHQPVVTFLNAEAGLHEGPNVNMEKALFYVDGVVTPVAVVKQMPAGELREVRMLNGKQALALYGEHTRYGIVSLVTKNGIGRKALEGEPVIDKNWMVMKADSIVIKWPSQRITTSNDFGPNMQDGMVRAGEPD